MKRTLPFLAALLLAPLAAMCASKPSGDADRYLKIVRAYADCMVEHGRDTYGKEHSPLFAEALDRRTLKMLEGDALKKAKALTFEEWLIRPNDRMLTGANPMHCLNLYQVLYALTEITSEKRYAAEADASLKYFFEHCQSPATGLLYWGEHAGWDLLDDAPIKQHRHEFYRPWVLWERCWNLAPEACEKFARGLWDHQIGDKKTGLYSRHGDISGKNPIPADAPYPRHGGFYIETWAFAYKRTQDKVFLKAIETVVDLQERMRLSGGMVVGGNLKSPGTRKAQDVGFAVSLWEAAALLPEPLAAKLRTVARANDIPASEDVAPQLKSPNLWSGGYGGAGGQIAGPANLLLLRYGQTKPDRYRERILAVADLHLSNPVNLDFPLHPDIFGKVIYLMLNAHEMTGDARYLDRADELARKAVELFLPDGCPLPKATHKHDHYEAVTNGDSLMMSLLQLWAARQNPPRKLPLLYTDR
ncbi:MAG: hypothetical protein FJ395_00595 [Verrucomicrobia bacterium]|nr:hypothetical protein [Verrucomicrobiota bacterium]